MPEQPSSAWHYYKCGEEIPVKDGKSLNVLQDLL